VQDVAQSLHRIGDRKKHAFASLDGTPVVISPNVLCECAPSPVIFIFHFSSISVQVWGNIAEKPRHYPPE